MLSKHAFTNKCNNSSNILHWIYHILRKLRFAFDSTSYFHFILFFPAKPYSEIPVLTRVEQYLFHFSSRQLKLHFKSHYHHWCSHCGNILHYLPIYVYMCSSLVNYFNRSMWLWSCFMSNIQSCFSYLLDDEKVFAAHKAYLACFSIKIEPDNKDIWSCNVTPTLDQPFAKSAEADIENYVPILN